MTTKYHNSCPVCNSNSFIALNNYSAHHLVRCTTCSMTFAHRIPSPLELENHYKGYSRGRFVSELTIQKYEELLTRFCQFTEGKRVLDVGCGSGFFLESAKNSGWDAIGTEYGSESIEHCTGKGLIVHEGDILTIDLPKDSFDVITSFEVIEHLVDPKSHIKRLFELLKPGGLLYITTPNINAVTRYILKEKWSIISYPEHLSYFTPHTLNKILVQEGFIKNQLTADGLSVDRLMNHFSKKNVVSENESPEKAKVLVTNESVRQASKKYLLVKLLRQVIDTTLNASGTGEFLKGLYIKPNNENQYPMGTFDGSI